MDTHNYLDVFPETNPLSNCFLVSVVYEGIEFPSVEHAYQAMKFYDHRVEDNQIVGWRDTENIFIMIRWAKTGPEAKEVARKFDSEKIMTNPDEKVGIMYEIMLAKFEQNPELLEILLSTREETIYEENPHSEEDSEFWGMNAIFGGENVIGNILMGIRTELNNE